MKILLSIGGASGSIYGIRLLEELKKASIQTYLIISIDAKKIIEHETNYNFSDLKNKTDFYYENDDMFAGPASGSFKLDAMIVCPCSMKTLSSIANGYGDTLTSRAASCILKEGKKLILVPRETPLSLPFINNIQKIKIAGATILPAMPGFYHKPKKIEDIINFIVGKILDQLNINHSLFERWK
jgi:4-hydroxy-3-polyprenylbenzoate decarboxylase